MISVAISAIRLALAAALTALLLLAPDAAQAQWAQYSAPVWGQIVAPRWGQYDYRIGANGWRYNQTLQPNEPGGAILNPNQIGASGGAPSIYTPPDTRLLGRTAP